VTVVATAVAVGGARFTRIATARISASAAHPFELLDWREDDPSDRFANAR
jgi:hypothetical protein